MFKLEQAHKPQSYAISKTAPTKWFPHRGRVYNRSYKRVPLSKYRKFVRDPRQTGFFLNLFVGRKIDKAGKKIILAGEKSIFKKNC